MADRLLAQLIAENEEYSALEIEILDEDINPEEVKNYTYSLVPNFWIDGVNVLEGIPNKKKLREVLDQGLTAK